MKEICVLKLEREDLREIDLIGIFCYLRKKKKKKKTT